MVTKIEAYSQRLNGLPQSDVLKFYYESEQGSDVCGSVVVKLSGTEPKLKIYIGVTANDKEQAEKIEVEYFSNVV